MNSFLSCRDCKWIPNDMKEEYLQNVKIVEEAMLRAVIAFQSVIFYMCTSVLSNLSIVTPIYNSYAVFILLLKFRLMRATVEENILCRACCSLRFYC